MKIPIQWVGILIVGLSLGTGWAIRGQFGHEQGAAWAGAIGAMSLVLVSKRPDWYRNIWMITLASAVGWGAAGIISYGAIAGRYAQSDNFPNVFYALTMLLFIGGLYGLIGGGLTGLVLNSTKEHVVKWSSLLVEMVAGGLVVHSLLVDQLEIQMSPPRSDAWAISLGAGLALLWHMARNNHSSPIRVAMYAALGGGFGFAFGTFFHLLMNWISLPFNTWNMAEYSIGFFGGMGLAYGVFSSKWPNESASHARWENRSALVILLLIIPLIIFRESFSLSLMMEKFQNFPDSGNIAFLSTFFAALIMLTMTLGTGYFVHKVQYHFDRGGVQLIFVTITLAYILLSYISTGFFTGSFMTNSNHHLYLVNLLVVLVLLGKGYPAFFSEPKGKMKAGIWFIALGLVLVMILLAFLSIPLHGPTDPSYDRFPIST